MSKEQEMIIGLLEHYGSYNEIEKATGINAGLWWRVATGGRSPTITRYLFPPKPRPRINIEATPELIKRFDAVCKAAGKTRAEVLADMVDIWEAAYS